MTPEKERLIKAIEATKELPKDWTVQIDLANDVKRAYLEDPNGELIEVEEIYDDFAELAEQIENCIAYAKANNDDYPQEHEDDTN